MHRSDIGEHDLRYRSWPRPRMMQKYPTGAYNYLQEHKRVTVELHHALEGYQVLFLQLCVVVGALRGHQKFQAQHRWQQGSEEGVREARRSIYADRILERYCDEVGFMNLCSLEKYNLGDRTRTVREVFSH